MARRLLFRKLLEVTEMKLDHLLLNYNLILILKITTGVRVWWEIQPRPYSGRVKFPYGSGVVCIPIMCRHSSVIAGASLRRTTSAYFYISSEKIKNNNNKKKISDVFFSFSFGQLCSCLVTLVPSGLTHQWFADSCHLLRFWGEKKFFACSFLPYLFTYCTYPLP